MNARISHQVFYKMYEHLLAAPKANEHSLLVSSATTTGVDVETVALHGTDKLGQSLDEDASDDKQDGVAGAASANSTSKKDLEQDSELDLLTPVLDCLKFLGLMGLYTGVTVAPCVYILDVAKVRVIRALTAKLPAWTFFFKRSGRCCDVVCHGRLKSLWTPSHHVAVVSVVSRI